MAPRMAERRSAAGELVPLLRPGRRPRHLEPRRPLDVRAAVLRKRRDDRGGGARGRRGRDRVRASTRHGPGCDAAPSPPSSCSCCASSRHRIPARSPSRPVEPSAPAAAPARQARRPDVVLVSIDTLRADHLGAYGRSPTITPEMDRDRPRGRRVHARRWPPVRGPRPAWPRCSPAFRPFATAPAGRSAPGLPSGARRSRPASPPWPSASPPRAIGRAAWSRTRSSIPSRGWPRASRSSRPRPAAR